jgi:hypothetical protein
MTFDALEIDLKSVNPERTQRSVRFAAIAFPLAYFLLILALRNFAGRGGWADFDARSFHFRVINHFLESGFNFDYPQDLIAMYPGMHLFFAAVGRVLGLRTMAYDGLAAFAIQSIFGIVLCIAAYKLTLKLCDSVLQAAFFLIATLSSSYISFSWISPTTELGSSALYLLMIIILIDERSGLRDALGFSFLATASTLFRHSNAPLSAAFAANTMLQNRKNGRLLFSNEIAFGLIPPFCAACVIGLVLYVFGGLTPPDFREEHQSGSINLVQIGHMVALTGLLGWPFVLFGWRTMSEPHAHPMLAIGASAFLATIFCLLVPMNYDPEHGRWGSAVWSIEEALRSHGLGKAAVWAELAIGFFVWIAIALQCGKARTVFPEIVLFGFFMASLLVQTVSWQRYIEVQLIVTLAIAFVRFRPTRTELLLFTSWYSIYLLGGVIKLIGSPVKY